MAANVATASSVPALLWAQRKDGIFLTVNVQDIADEKVDLTASSLTFCGER